MARAWEIADSVKRERLLEDPDYVDLLEKMGVLLDEIEELKDSIKRLNEPGYLESNCRVTGE